MKRMDLRAARPSVRAMAAAAVLAAASVGTVPAAAQDARADGTPDRVIVFGDSLADGGFYAALQPLPPGEGSFTTNPDPVAPEVFARLLGYDLRPVYGQGGTNYAVGGARVAARTPTSPLAIPVATQIGNFLAAGGTFGANDVVYIQGGGNDYFAFAAGGATNPALLTDAATALAAQVQRLEQAGARRIVTLSVQSNNPGFDLFNTTYKNALASNNANVLFFDNARLFREIVTNAATFGITNTTGTACRGSSLTCGPEDYVTPNANRTYLLADAVHPAGITQQIQGQAIASLFTGFTLPGSIARAGQRTLRSARNGYEGAQRNGLNPEGGLSVFAHANYDYFAERGAGGLMQNSVGGSAGLAFDASPAFGVGVVGGYTDGDGRIFGRGDSGRIDQDAWTVSGYARAALGPLQAIADVTYGEGDVALERTIPLGPVLRVQRASPDTQLLGARGALRFDFAAGPFRVGPEAGVAYERVRVDGFTEDGGTSTALAVGAVQLESFTGRAGLVASAPIANGTGFFARAGYVHEFEDDMNRFTVTPTGAPVSYTSAYRFGTQDYGELAMGVSGTLGPVGVRAGAAAEFARSDQRAINAYAGIMLPF